MYYFFVTPCFGNQSLLIFSIAPAIITASIIFSVTAIVALVIWFAVQYEKKRTEAFADVAAELGLQFSATEDESLLKQMHVFPLFNKGYNRKMKNVMTAETDMTKLAIFDYQYKTGGGKNTQIHNFTFVSMQTDSLYLPQFSVRPEGFFDRIGSKLGFQDIDFEDHPEFSDAFVLKGNDEASIRRFFDTQVLDLFASKKNVVVEAHESLMLYRTGSGRKKPDQIQEFMTEAYEFLSGFQKKSA